MGKRTLAETIKETTRRHLEENNGLLLGQSITAVGWVNGTVPDVKGIIELPMTDVAGAGIAVGTAMVGRRPIFVLRFQDFLILNASPLIFYAAKSKELHGKATPIFVRALSTEGIGPVHSDVLHGVFMHFPGFRVAAPVTPGEFEEVFQTFLDNDDPVICSEHRDTFKVTEEMENVIHDKADITLFPISCTRLHVAEAARILAEKGIVCNIMHVLWLKPFDIIPEFQKALSSSKLGLVIDPGFEICGASRSLAYELTDHSGFPVKALAIEDKTKCLCPPFENRAPGAVKIVEKVIQLCRKSHGTE